MAIELARLRKENEILRQERDLLKKSDRLLRQGNKSMRYKLVDTNKATTSVERMCRMMAVSVSGYYAWKVRKPSLHQCYDVVLAANFRAQFASSNQTYGAPRMHAELFEEGLSVGRHRVARLMRQNGLKAHQKRRFKKTTDSHHDCPIATNVLDQNFACEDPDQKWGADISYIWTAEG
jgi:putative transposase